MKSVEFYIYSRTFILQVSNLKKQADSKKLSFVVAIFFIIVILLVIFGQVVKEEEKVIFNKPSSFAYTQLWFFQIEIYEDLWFIKEGRRLLIYTGHSEVAAEKEESHNDVNVMLTVHLGVPLPEKSTVYQCFHPHDTPKRNPVSLSQ